MTTDSSGTVRFVARLQVKVRGRQFISATATVSPDETTFGATSEFSADLRLPKGNNNGNGA